MFFKKKRKIAYTINGLGNLACKSNVVHLPVYKRKNENSFIVQPRGLIFVSKRKKKKFDV